MKTKPIPKNYDSLVLNEDPVAYVKTLCCKSKSHWSKSILHGVEQERPTDLEETPD